MVWRNIALGLIYGAIVDVGSFGRLFLEGAGWGMGGTNFSLPPAGGFGGVPPPPRIANDYR